MNDQPERSEAFHARIAATVGAVPEADVAELRKDAERLNYLESGHDVFRWQKDGPSDGMVMHGWIVGDVGLELARSSVREAIDAAMNQP